MRILGISEGFHDAGVCLIEDQKILYASHSERYSRIKNDRNVHPKQYKKSHKIPFYEKPWLKHTRRFLCGQSFKPCTTNYDISFYHHQTHAAAGYYTAPFNDCNILVVDSIGEWDTISIWDNMKKIKSWKYHY